MPVRNAWQALALPPSRFLRSSWPWRSLAFLVSGVALSAVLLVVLAVLLLAGLALVVVGIGVVLLVMFVLAGVPLAVVERARIRWVDEDPIEQAHPVAAAEAADAEVSGGRIRQARPVVWARARLHEPATWRELAYALVTAGALWFVDSAVLAFTLLLPVLCVLAPLDDPSAWPSVLAGIALLVLAPYVLTAWAGARAALGRALLAPRAEELGVALTEVTRSRARLVEAFDVERARLEQDLHDGVQQRLTSLGLTLGLMRLDHEPGSATCTQLGLVHEQVDLALGELRDLVRGVRPQVLVDFGLPAAIDDVATRSPIPVDLDVDLADRVPAAVETALYFVVMEALTNVTRHSAAERAAIRARWRNGAVVVEVRDDGRGGADPTAGTGLVGLADRLAAHGGRLRISSPSGGPTLLRAEVPVR